jgi:tripartite-type tricarboxylate transporter receptor subunit TctC
VTKLLSNPEVAEKLRLVRNEPFASTPEENRAHIATQRQMYRKVVEVAGAKAE